MTESVYEGIDQIYVHDDRIIISKHSNKPSRTAMQVLDLDGNIVVDNIHMEGYALERMERAGSYYYCRSQLKADIREGFFEKGALYLYDVRTDSVTEFVPKQYEEVTMTRLSPNGKIAVGININYIENEEQTELLDCEQTVRYYNTETGDKIKEFTLSYGRTNFKPYSAYNDRFVVYSDSYFTLQYVFSFDKEY